jgi:uncharacterized protein
MNDNKQGHFSGRIVSTILICATFIWGIYYYVGQMKNPIVTKSNDGTAMINTITVNGDGKVFGKPDILKIQIGITELTPTTKEAQTKLDANIQKVINALHANAVVDKDIQTIELSLNQEIEYNNNTRKIIGQRATQRFLVTIRNIQKDLTISGKVIDAVTLINGVEINSMQFDIEDKTDLFTIARELAYKKANQKATELAKLSGLTLSKPVSINEIAQQPYYNAPYQNAYYAKSMNATDSSAQIPTGQMEITIQLEVIFSLK